MRIKSINLTKNGNSNEYILTMLLVEDISLDNLEQKIQELELTRSIIEGIQNKKD